MQPPNSPGENDVYIPVMFCTTCARRQRSMLITGRTSHWDYGLKVPMAGAFSQLDTDHQPPTPCKHAVMAPSKEPQGHNQLCTQHCSQPRLSLN